MSACVVIPWRTDHGWREQLFFWVLAAWEATGLDVVVGHPDDEGPFNCSQALNRARAKTDAEYLVVAAADHIPDLDAVRRAVSHGAPWAPIFSATAGLGRTATELLLDGADPAFAWRYTSSFAPFCTALLAVRADVWDEVGGWDERFVGWGCEDTAFRLALETLHPDPPVPAATSIALWHEAAPRDHFDANAALLGGYIAASGSPDAMRAFLEAR